MTFILKKRQGFTILELIIVINLIGILAMISINRYYDLKHSANVSVCKLNQQHLITAQRLFWINSSFDMNNSAHYADNLNDLIPFLQNGVIPTCPENGSYFIVRDEIVHCDIADHTI